jgi:hypothetical protein
VRRARTIMRLPDVQKWCRESVAKISATPFQLHVDQGPDVVFQDKKVAADEVRPSDPKLSRIIYTTKGGFRALGIYVRLSSVRA